MRSFKSLQVWQKAHKLTLEIYTVTARYPKEEQYSLISQTRRACSSIAANIAEGCGRGSDADFSRFLFISMGSASEVEYHLILARDLNFLTEGDFDQLTIQVIEVKKMLASLLQRTTNR